MTLAARTKLGPYEILSPLGAGGMGEVYRARDTRLGRDVAVKVLPERLAQDDQFRQHFEREARAASLAPGRLEWLRRGDQKTRRDIEEVGGAAKVTQEVEMASPIDLRIWKHSHGTNKTTPDWSNEDRERFKADRLLKIFANTKRGQIQNFQSMRPGDFLFLCHGNDIQLLGIVSTDILNPRGDPLERKYTVVRRLEDGPWKFKGHRKGWSPGGNTTCWPVDEADHPEFENDILRPFFGMKLSDLAGWARQARRLPTLEPAELPPSPPVPRPYKRLRVPPSKNTGPSARLYDPDKTGHRAKLHNRCLGRLARVLRRGRTLNVLTSNKYDLLALGKKNALLMEAKTLQNDEEHQLRIALGQLIFYEHLSVESKFPGCNVFRLALTDRVPPGFLVDLLEKYRVGVAWTPERQQAGASKLGGRLLKTFGVVLE